ncbi:class I SAM-dependent methyltransferase [Streptosporangium sp. 'caverna']|uniref:class I SAM-dependent DNA methyltransferase n=1 Tax=Streptosporangium sp. 'caverna' TaxID=2202249 RepID=UPI000D7D487B|nr:SAM-dependent methyltransferase [Streptosporangium sp. 'caverna']AWS45717.1 SAM-dependent methyltransferase [Streptosporangium sp. 'caverna']
MTAEPSTLGPEYFDHMYSASPDPWGFASRWYEERKYAVSAAMLPSRRYRDAFEVGCSIGVFTALLAPRCDRLLACDLSPVAVAAAAERTAGYPWTRVERRTMPGDWPLQESGFDLIVLSEVLYYFGGEDLNRMLDLATAALSPGGTLLAVHWRHPVAEYPRGGEEVHHALAGRTELTRLVDHREPDFLAEVYLRGSTAPSVAETEGLM